MTDTLTRAEAQAALKRAGVRDVLAHRIVSVGWHDMDDGLDPLAEVQAAMHSADVPALVATLHKAMELLGQTLADIRGDSFYSDGTFVATERDITILLTHWNKEN